MWPFTTSKRKRREDKAECLSTELHEARKRNAEAADKARKIMQDYLSQAVDDVAKEFR